MSNNKSSMGSIKVSVLPPTEAGRLYPRYVKVAHLLSVKSRIARPWPFGVGLNGGMIFDLDERRVLANFELHEMRSMWKREDRE